MTDRKFYKTIFEVTVLSEELLESMSLGELSYECMEGDLSGSMEIKETVTLNGKQIADELEKQNSDPEFFRIDKNGEDIE